MHLPNTPYELGLHRFADVAARLAYTAGARRLMRRALTRIRFSFLREKSVAYSGDDTSQEFLDTSRRSSRNLASECRRRQQRYLHVAIFRFAKEHINDAVAAFLALTSASRQELGNLGYDIYRGIDDDQEFYVVEHWASPEALAAHERSEAFIHFGQDVLVRHATLHDTVTGRAVS